MPAEVGYGPSVNLAAEVSRPPTVPTQVTRSATETDDRQPVRADAPQDENRTDSGADQDDGDTGNTTADRGQNLNITA